MFSIWSLLQHQGRLLNYALLSLARQWQKQAFFVLIYSLVVGFFASIIFFTDALRQETQMVLKDLPELWVQKLAGGRLVPMPQSFVDSLQNIRGIQKVEARIWGYNFDSPTGAVFTLIGSDKLLDGLELIEGKSSGRLADNEALCGTGFLELRGLRLQENITLLDSEGTIQSFKVVGSFESASDLLTRDLIILSPKSARKILALPAQACTDVALHVANPQEIENIGRKIDRRFAGIRVVSATELRRTYEALFGWRGGIFIYGAMLSLLAFMILAWDRASGLSQQERKELGVLKAIGWQISEVLWLKFWEGIVVALTSSLIGILLAYLHVFWLQAPLLRPFLIGWSVLYPHYDLMPFLSGGSILLILSLSLIPYLTATLYPAWRAAIIDPSEAMQ